MSDATKRPRYYAVWRPAGYWQVIGPSGLPVTDNEPDWKQRERTFANEDEAMDYAEKCNLSDDGETEEGSNEKA